MDAQLCRSTLASLPVGVCVVASEGLIVDLNPAAERFLGTPLADICGQPLHLALQRAIPDGAHALSWNVMLSKAMSADELAYIDLPTEFRVRERRPGVSLVGVGAPWIGEAGQRLGTVLLLLEHQALGQDRAPRDRFLSVVSHELGVPVTSILAAAEHLSARLDPADRDTARLVGILVEEANRLRGLLSQILSETDARLRSPPAEGQPVALEPLILRVVETGRLRHSDHTLAVDLPPRLPTVCAEPDRVLQVLNMLVDNALKYSPPDSEVVVSAGATADAIVVAVSDRGPALPEDEAQRLFEPFFRGRAAHHTPGQGMGLPIARSVVRAAGGELWYEAPAGGGNRFCFTLPRREEKADEPR